MGLHGRDADLALLEETLATAASGRGRALFLTGEPGIGKSTLLAEARHRTRALVLAGAAWEAGGAPPYWPWQQVLRDAATRLGDRVRTLPGADRVASLVAEWRATEDFRGSVTEPPALTDASAARFALLDAVVRSLLAIAEEQPIVILLDDLHAADVPSLDLLALLVRELPRAPIALVGAWRESELALREDAAQRLTRASRGATVHPLRRLTADEVTSWVGNDGAAIFAASEGNPLFVEETLHARRGGTTRGMQAVIADHLALASIATREILAVASVLGRDIDATIVAMLAGVTRDATESALREAASVGIVETARTGSRFRHILLRDHLYAGLTASHRADLHRALGEHLAVIDPMRAAHHMLAGVSGDDVVRAVELARAAASEAERVYAFDAAVDLLAAASRVLEGTRWSRELVAADVLIELARAEHHVGRLQQARANCVKAAELARQHEDVDRLARASMVYAAELASGTRDHTMIALLEEAAAKLPADDNPPRARVLARLASALVPGPHDEVMRALQIARDAVAMARRIDDPETTMFALRYAAHAQAYTVSLAESLAMAREVVAIADRLGRPIEAIDHRAWLVGGNLASGDFATAHAVLESCAGLLAPLSQPQYRWRMPVLRAGWATRAGRFTEADRNIQIARELASEYDLDRAMWAARFASLGQVAATRDPARAEAFLEDAREPLRSRLGYGAGNINCFALAIAGRHDEARAELAQAMFLPTLIIVHFTSETIALLGEREHAARVLPIMEQQVALNPLVHGPQGGLFVRPSMMVLGELYALLGRIDDAIAAYCRGLELARLIKSPVGIASGASALAKFLDERGRSEDRARARALGEEAATLQRLLAIDTARSDTPRSTSHAAPPDVSQAARTEPLLIATASNGPCVRWRGREVVTPTGKGIEYLAMLVAAPGREIHVSDLVGDDDRGDAGEVLDAKARSSYRARAEELQSELETATERNDLGRIERLRAELEAITDELVGATGLGGRARKAGSRVERARVNVQRRIKDAIRRLATEDEALGRYLEATIRTGTFCSFVPLDS